MELKNKIFLTALVAIVVSIACVAMKKCSNNKQVQAPQTTTEEVATEQEANAEQSTTGSEQTIEEEKAMDFTEVHAKHILVADEGKANEILKDIENGKISFEDAAKQYSTCASASDGGDLGFFKKGTMVKEFEDAAFVAENGAIVGPVKTQFGWHLIKVLEKR